MNKNNFILYKDFEPTLDLLNDEQSGKLFKAIYRYVNGRNEPNFENDGMLIVAFNMIKTQLERDLIKYKNTVERNKKNGAKGGRPTNKGEKTHTVNNNPSGSKITHKDKKIPKKADSDSGSVSDNDSVSDSKKTKAKKVYMEFVKLTDDEYSKLLEKFGESGTKDQIENLNNYIGSKGTKYKSHYHTILTWDRKNKPNQQTKTEERIFTNG